MDTIFTLGDGNDDIKLNMDELYERKKVYDLNTVKIYNKILTRIHNKIRHFSKQSHSEQHCWFLIPEVIIGIPKYDHGSCTAYIIDKLRENGFQIRYTHPNLLFISWKNWTPSYVREEIKKKTGIKIDGFGNKIEDIEIKSDDKSNNLLLNTNSNIKLINSNNKGNYKEISSYKPSGSLIYNKETISKIENKLEGK